MTYPVGELASAHKFTHQSATKVATEWFVCGRWHHRWNGRYFNMQGLGWATMMRYYFFQNGNGGGSLRRVSLCWNRAGCVRAHRIFSLQPPESGLTGASLALAVSGLTVTSPGFPYRFDTRARRAIVRAVAVATITTSSYKNRVSTAGTVVTSP